MSDSVSESQPATGPQTAMGKVKLPNAFIVGVIIVCVLPFLLNLCGVDFTSRAESLDLAVATDWETPQLQDAMLHAMQGPFVHTILELLAHCAAIFAVVLAFTHYRMTGDITMPIIGMALFCAAMVDAFHTLAADRLISAVADDQSLIPFTWAISRTFNAVILIVGAGVFLVWDRRTSRTDAQGNLTFLWITSGVFLFLSYAIVHFCAASGSLPRTMFPDSLITRPWDVGPLILFLLAGLVVFPLFHRKYPSLFSLALIVSIIPQVATQLHMAFGSTALFDNDFHVAHFLKVFAYLIPLGGLILEYRQTYQRMRRANASLNEKTVQLQRQELQTREVVAQLTRAGEEIVAATGQQAASTAEQVSSLQEISTAMVEISQSGRGISQRASQLASGAEAASTASQAGLSAVQETTRSMGVIQQQVKSLAGNIQRLSEKTQSIGEIVAISKEIAEQTKMLALNASIEAARSGVEGSGFAVVAKQMKELADESKASTGRVHVILEDIRRAIESSAILTEEAVTGTESGKETTQIAERAIRDLTDTIGKNVSAARHIVRATDEQQDGIEQVTEGMGLVRTGAAQTSTITEHVQHAAADLNVLAQRLQAIVET